MSQYDYDYRHDSRGIKLSYKTRLPASRWKEEDDLSNIEGFAAIPRISTIR